MNAQTKKVVIYSTPGCSYCRLAKEFFGQNQIEYQDHNVATDAARRQDMINKSGQMGVPVIAISDPAGANEEIVIGFDEPHLRQLLGR